MEIPYLDTQASQVTIEVTLPYAANVNLVDQHNFNLYRNGSAYEYYGGYATQSPVTISAPNTGNNRWYLIVDNPNGASINYQYRWI
ncbi:DUF1883 domain-containing protein [Weissella viridescens]|uniref:DUF1883 domain-containing protein n=1 Tax=Weissella viridescens TaxID=1629 RepID=UPI003AF20060